MERRSLSRKTAVKFSQSWHQPLMNLLERSDVNRAGDDIVARLPEVDMVVRVNRFVATPAAKEFDCAVRDHFVGIHVRRSSRASLENIDHELAVQTAVNHFLRSLLNSL